MIRFIPLVLLLSTGLAGRAEAHRPSDAYLTLRFDEQTITGQWEIALRDLELLAPLDQNADRRLTWGELRTAQPQLEAAIRYALALGSRGEPCPLNIEGLKLNDRLDGRFAWFDLRGSCPHAPSQLTVDYRLLFDIDPAHRGILVLATPKAALTAVLDPSRPRVFDVQNASALQAFGDYLWEGVWHIWIGYDHVLFLAALLIPAVLVWRVGRWQPEDRLAPALWKTVGIVTAFTLAHSVTLALAAFGVLKLPSSFVECAIALSVLLAAANNVRPVVTRGLWAMALGFGLIHGFGFAAVFGELGLARELHLLSLLAFNLGVEVGQLCIVLAVMPVLYGLRRTAFYCTGIRVLGSGIVAIIAAYWLMQRTGIASA